MWGIFIIVFKPAGKLSNHSFGIRLIIAEDVIPLECFDESFSHTVALGAASLSKLADDAQRGGKSYCFFCCVAGSVVGEPFNWLQCFDIPKPFFNACQHDALRHVSTLLASGGGRPSLPGRKYPGKNNAHPLSVVAGQSQTRPSTNADTFVVWKPCPCAFCQVGC